MKLLFSKCIILACCTSFHGLAISQNLSLDEKLGDKYSNTIEREIGIYENAPINKYLDSLGNKLIKNLNEPAGFNYSFKILDMHEPNAFALPGGHVYVTRGLLSIVNNEDELAGVISHEIVHTEDRHTVKHIKKSILPALLQLPGVLSGALINEDFANLFTPLDMGSNAIISSYSRSHERQADKRGIELMARAGYDPKSLGKVLNKLADARVLHTGNEEKRSYLNKHPFTPKRLSYIEKMAESLEVKNRQHIYNNAEEYLALIKGLTCKENPAQGLFCENEFMHPDMDIYFNFPEHWLKMNKASMVGAVDSSGQGLIYLQQEDLYNSADTAMENVKPRMVQNFGASNVKGMQLDINGHHAQLISIINHNEFTPYYLFVLWIEHRDQVYRIIAAGTETHKETLKNAAQSFTSLTKKQKASINNTVIQVATSRDDETLKSLGERTNNVWDTKTTAIMNGIDKETPLEKGKRIKIAVKVPYTCSGEE